MTFLELCQHVNLYGGFQGEISSVNATGYQALLVDAVRKAWFELQRKREWDFMYTSVSFSVSSATSTYTPATIFGTSTETLGMWDKDRIVYDYKPLRYIPYEDFVLIDQQSTGEPSYYTINPSDRSIIFNDLDDNYSITAYYTKTPQILTNNTDTPDLPQKHHHIVIYAALLELAAYVSSAEVYQKNLQNYNAAYSELLRDHCPAKTMKFRPFV